MKIVRNIKNLISRGHTYYKIAKRLNGHGVDTKERGKNGWSQQTVKNVYNYHYGEGVRHTAMSA